MKTIKYLLVSCIMTITLVGCDNVLNQEPMDAFTNDNYWTSEGNVDKYANAFFNTFTGYGNGTGAGLFYYNRLNDDQLGSGFDNWDQVASAKSAHNALWKDTYGEIKRANVMITKVPTMDMLPEPTNNWLGVAKLMRAYNYFVLVRSFGDVQWVTKPLETNDTEILYGKRTDRDIVMDSVLNDLNFACENIVTEKGNCVWSKALANAIKSDICLFEGTFCKYRVKGEGSNKDASPDRAKTYLEECVKANDVLMGMGYDLEPGVEGYAATYNSLDLTNSNQVIFAKHYVKDIFMHSLIDFTMGTTVQHGINKSGFEAFKLRATGMKANWTTDYPIVVKNGTGSMADEKFLSLEDVLALRDARLSCIVDPVLAYPGCGYVRWDADLNGVDDSNPDNIGRMTSPTGLTILKFASQEVVPSYRIIANKNYTDAPLYWYAVTLLNQAEAKAELGTITDADLNATVNKLRERGGLPALTTGNYYDELSLIEAIHNDRRCELMLDNQYRFWDLIRWHQLKKMSSENPDIYLGMKISADPKLMSGERTEATTDADGFLTPSYTQRREYDPKYYIYPIPADECELNNNLGQNPGWEKK